MPRFHSLADWLAWQEGLHPQAIDLGLQRVITVADRLGLLHPDSTVVSVAGTNGKGSCVALLEAIYRDAGYRTGSYTSPHLLRYNERIRIDGSEVSDTVLCAAFEQIDRAREGLSLTYFEFGTLAALQVFSAARPDIVLLEVGMGGRLDAVNSIDADVALVTSIGIDHSAWLGTDREAIGREKAGIFRSDRPAVCATPSPPASLRQAAIDCGALWYAPGRGFMHRRTGQVWDWLGWGGIYKGLPFPVLGGERQLDNAAGVLAVVELLGERLPVSRAAIEQGLLTARLAGRFQVRSGPPQLILDVAHNPDSAGMLASQLQDDPVTGRTWLVLGMLADKETGAFADALDGCVDRWCLAGLGGARGLPAVQLGQRIAGAGRRMKLFDSVAAALAHAMGHAAPDDRIVVSGSFMTVSEALVSPSVLPHGGRARR